MTRVSSVRKGSNLNRVNRVTSQGKVKTRVLASQVPKAPLGVRFGMLVTKTARHLLKRSASRHWVILLRRSSEARLIASERAIRMGTVVAR